MSAPPAASSGLSTGAKAGIIVGSVVGFLIILSLALLWWKKRRARNPVVSTFDPRFGALDITSPNDGAYTNPSNQASPTTQTFVKYNPSDFVDAEKSPGRGQPYSPTLTEYSSIGGSQPSSPYGPGTASGSGTTSARASMPVHQAYIANPRLTLQSGKSIDIPSPPPSAPLRTPNSIHSTMSTSSPRVSPTAIPSYRPAQYASRRESTGAGSQISPPLPLAMPVPVRALAGRGIEQSPDSTHSVEQWPGDM